MDKTTILDQLEADGATAIKELQATVGGMKKRVQQHSDRRIVQLAKLNALGNIIFQELLEEIKQQIQR